MFRVVLGMSQSLREIRDKLIDATDPLDHHIIKLALYPDCNSKEHWRVEVYSYLNSVKRAKNTNKFPSYKFIRDALATDEDILEGYIEQVLDQYSNLSPCGGSYEAIINQVTRYHDWLAEQFSTKGYVKSSEVFSKLDELGL